MKQLKLHNIRNKIRNIKIEYFYPSDKGILRTFKKEEKIEWLKGRLYYCYLNPLIRIFREKSKAQIQLRQTRKRKVTDFMIAAFSVVLNGIESMGSFILGKRKCDNCKSAKYKPDEAFEIFVSKYLDGKWKRHSKNLYKNFRCGIAHGFLIEGGGISYEVKEDPGFETTPDGQLLIHPWAFLADLDEGIDKYFRDLIDDNNLKIKFIERFNEIYK